MEFLMRLIRLALRRNNFPRTKHIIKYAFTCGGIEYRCFDDAFNIPYQRGLQAIVYFTEVRQNCDREYLENFYKAMKNCLNPTAERKTIEVHKANQVNELLGQRLELPPDTELLYKLASVVYFDDTENPEVYEFGYGAKKIEFWKKNASVKDFFLQKPIVELLPFLKDVGENIEIFHGMMQDVNRYHSESLSDAQSATPKKRSGNKSNSSSAETPQS
jgi:hypothetical protein